MPTGPIQETPKMIDPKNVVPMFTDIDALHQQLAQAIHEYRKTDTGWYEVKQDIEMYYSIVTMIKNLKDEISNNNSSGKDPDGGPVNSGSVVRE